MADSQSFDGKHLETIINERLKRASTMASNSTTVLLASAISFILLLFQNTIITPEEARDETRLANYDRRISDKEKEQELLQNPRGGVSSVSLSRLKILSDEITELRNKRRELNDRLTKEIELPLSIKLRRERVKAQAVPWVNALLGLAALGCN